MNIATVTSTPLVSTYRRAGASQQAPIEENNRSGEDDVLPGFTVRPEVREEVRSLDDALLLVASLRTGILSKGRDALSAQANQDSSGLADLLS
ncbi:MAG: hypothetical protein U0136_21450 [Bdellovibrionota bacterium]